MALTDGSCYIPGDLLIYERAGEGYCIFIYVAGDLWLACDNLTGTSTRLTQKQWTPSWGHGRSLGGQRWNKLVAIIGNNGEVIR